MDFENMRKLNEIIIHCSATKPSIDVGAIEIRNWHITGNGWSDIGYHYVIRRNGEVEEGRPLERSGAHTKGHNKASIGVCLVGGVDSNGNPEDNFTKEQYEGLEKLLNVLLMGYCQPDTKVRGHNYHNKYKACPSFDWLEWLKNNGFNHVI